MSKNKAEKERILQKNESKIGKFISSLFTFPLSYEVTFVVLATIFGLWFVYLNPPFHSNDEDRHFLKAYHITQEGLVPELSPDSTKIGSVIPTNIPQVVMAFQGVPYFQGQKLTKRRVDELSQIPQNRNQKTFEHNFQWSTFPISYLPASIGIMLADSDDATPVALGYAGRIGMLFFYILTVFFAIRIAPVWKSVIFLYGLTPMVLYQASSVTYDVMSNSLTFLMLGIGLFYIFDKNAKIGFKELIFILLLIYMQRVVKNGFYLLSFMFLFIPNSRFEKNLNPWLFRGIILGALIIFIQFGFSIWNMFLSDIKSGYKNVHGFQKDFKFDNSYRINNEIMGDPFGFISLYIKNWIWFRQEWLAGTIGRFGYSYSNLSNGFFLVHGLALIAVSVLDSGKNYEIPKIAKYGIFALGVLTFLAVTVGFFVGSPVGSNVIFGFQGRYFVPAVPFLLFIMFNNKIEVEFWEKWQTTILGFYVVFMLAYAASEMDALFYAY
jgi:uncharacterized membrane protein